MPTAVGATANRSRRGRAALFWGAVVFRVCQVGLAGLIETRRPEFRDPPYWVKHRLLRRRLAEGPSRPVLVVMLGSSRTAFGFNGQALEAPLGEALGRRVVVFNLGIYGAGPINQRVFLRRLLDD